MKKICIVGLGNMGQAIHLHLSAKKLYEIDGFDRDEAPDEHLASCDIIILAVKPQDFEKMCEKVSVGLSEKLVISIMAGVGVARIISGLKVSKVVRVMPNLPLRCGSALSGWFASGEISDLEKELVREILGSFGEEVEVENEDQIDKITALSGSGPAYYFHLNKLMRMKALEMGFSDDQARKIVRGTFLGAADLLKQGPECSEEFIKKVTSKGGTTEAALNHLEEKEFDKIFADAVEMAYKRAKELNN